MAGTRVGANADEATEAARTGAGGVVGTVAAARMLYVLPLGCAPSRRWRVRLGPSGALDCCSARAWTMAACIATVNAAIVRFNS